MPPITRRADCLILCPSCEQRGDTSRITFTQSDVEVSCGDCGRHYLVETAELGSATDYSPAHEGFSRYRIFMKTDGDKLATVAFEAPNGVKLVIGDRVTVVRRGGKVVGVANQTHSRWYAMPTLDGVAVGGFARRVCPLAAGIICGVWAGFALREMAGQVPLSLGSLIAVLAVGGVLSTPWFASALRSRSVRSEKRTERS